MEHDLVISTLDTRDRPGLEAGCRCGFRFPLPDLWAKPAELKDAIDAAVEAHDKHAAFYPVPPPPGPRLPNPGTYEEADPRR